MSKENLIKKIFWYFVIGVTFIQVVFALIWMKGNAGTYFEEMLSNNYIEAAKTLKVNDYMGIAYALLIKILGHGFVLYLVQMFSVFFSAVLFSNTFVSDFRKWIVGVFLVSNPFILQACFKVLPGAFIVAFSLVALYAIRQEKVIVFLVADIALGLMNPDYAFLSFFVMLPFAIYRCVKKKAKAWSLLGSVVGVAIVCILVNGLITDVNAYGSVKRTVPFLCMQRLEQGHLTECADIVSMYYGVDMTGEMIAADRVSELIVYDFCAKFEELFGKEAQAAYMYFAKMGLQKGFKRYGIAIIRDFGYYFFAPMSVSYIWSAGKTETLLANPLYDFTKNQGYLSKAYVMFSVNAIYTLLILGIVALVMYIFDHKNSVKEVNKFLLSRGYLYLIAWIALYGTFICIRGFDYRNCLFSIIAWPLMAISAFGNKRED